MKKFVKDGNKNGTRKSKVFSVLLMAGVIGVSGLALVPKAEAGVHLKDLVIVLGKDKHNDRHTPPPPPPPPPHHDYHAHMPPPPPPHHHDHHAHMPPPPPPPKHHKRLSKRECYENVREQQRFIERQRERAERGIDRRGEEAPRRIIRKK